MSEPGAEEVVVTVAVAVAVVVDIAPDAVRLRPRLDRRNMTATDTHTNSSLL
jgi:hypothetical protein